MIGMRCRDVVLEGQPAAHLRGKGRKERSVPLWRPTAALIRSWRRQIGDPSGDSILFPNRSGGRMTRSNVTQRLNLAVATAGRKNPGLLDRPVTPHTVRTSAERRVGNECVRKCSYRWSTHTKIKKQITHLTTNNASILI